MTRRRWPRLILPTTTGLLTEEKKILNLVRMRMFVNVPYFAGDLAGERNGGRRVERNEKNLDLLLIGVDNVARIRQGDRSH